VTYIATRLKGAVQDAARIFERRTSLYATLIREQTEISMLCDEAIEEESAQKRDALLSTIRLELLSHHFAEEVTLLNALVRFDDTRLDVGLRQCQHQEAELLLNGALAAPPGTDAQTAALEELCFTIEQANEQERRLFERAEPLLSKTEEECLQFHYQQLKMAKRGQLETHDRIFLSNLS
jgi:hypothetical protein